MGDVGNLAEPEQRRILEATLGNITSGTQGVADRLRNLSAFSKRMIVGRLENFKTGFEQGGDALMQELSEATTGPATTGTNPTGLAVGGTFQGETITNIRRIR
jgi:hypothetical protein